MFLACLIAPASAAERVTVATTRDVGNAVLFLAAARGYFKAEGLALTMRAYPDAPAAAEALAMGAADLGLMAFSARAFALAGSGKMKAIAGQVREERGYEGSEIVASNGAHGRGLHGFADLANKTIALTALGSIDHYQLALIAERQGFALNAGMLKPLHSVDAVAQAVAMDKVDAAILPPLSARELFLAGRGYPVGWCSGVDATPLGALFASAKTLAGRHAMVEKFVRAYRRGAAAYAAALFRQKPFHKHNFDDAALSAATAIGRYLFPDHPAKSAAPVVVGAVYFMDATARLEPAALAREIAWFKAQSLIDKRIDVQSVVDLTFIKSLPAGK